MYCVLPAADARFSIPLYTLQGTFRSWIDRALPDGANRVVEKFRVTDPPVPGGHDELPGRQDLSEYTDAFQLERALDLVEGLAGFECTLERIDLVAFPRGAHRYGDADFDGIRMIMPALDDMDSEIFIGREYNADMRLDWTMGSAVFYDRDHRISVGNWMRDAEAIAVVAWWISLPF